ncbi:hypothetical protein MP638_003776 [Amoeboaphelidium occidentale]|nr:hypothetical protein MP638_003776 [Amoeboaphelidium occidentale]
MDKYGFNSAELRLSEPSPLKLHYNSSGQNDRKNTAPTVPLVAPGKSNRPKINTSMGHGKQLALPVSSPLSPQYLGIAAKKYILYLEPSRESKFYENVIKFYSESKARFGHNEAQMYHPHCSMTGFFDLPIHGNGFWHQEMLTVLEELMVSTSAMSNIPKLCDFHTKQKPRSLSVKVDAPAELKDIVARFQKHMDQRMKTFLETHHGVTDSVELRSKFDTFFIRPKPMDHISLAYIRPNSLYHDDGSLVEELNENEMDFLIKLSQDFQILADKNVGWYVVLYEVDHKSDILGVPHKFREIRKWKIA